MKTLHLTVKKKWFDMIASGEKREEYREIKSYWITRLVDSFLFRMDTVDEFISWSHRNNLQLVVNKFDTIIFRNGYSKNSPVIEVKCQGIEVGYGLIYWGAEKNKEYFIIKLGNLIKLN